MNRTTFLTAVAVVAGTIGLFALVLPDVLLVAVKHAEPNPAALVMTRTVGVLLITMGVLNALVRSHSNSPTLRAVLAANLVLQVAIAPIDPLAWLDGTFHTLGSFLPNTGLHIALAAGFGVLLWRARPAESAQT
ncbi:MAG: hypothetical protein AB8I08_16195 [Sandaracinaceae bacterium]